MVKSEVTPSGCHRSNIVTDALKAWERGALVAIPTETVIGLGAPVNEETLIKKIFSYKERPFYDPLIVHVSTLKQAKSYARNWGDIEEKLAKDFWPGPLTLIVKKQNTISDLITSGLDTVGLRVPASQKTRELISALGHGVAAPSANKFTKTSPTSLEHVESAFKDSELCLLVEDDPEFESRVVGIESTIVKVDGKNVSILRPGAITPQDIRDSLSEFDFVLKEGVTAFEEKGKQMMAPGTLPVHYRPSYDLGLVEENNLNEFKEDYGLETFEEWEVISLDLDPALTARKIYYLMQEPLSENKTKKLFVLPSPSKRNSLPKRQQELWLSILNRLEKAASK